MLEVHLFGVFFASKPEVPHMDRDTDTTSTTYVHQPAMVDWLTSRSKCGSCTGNLLNHFCFSLGSLCTSTLSTDSSVYKHQFEVPLKKDFTNGSLLTSRVDELCNSSKCHVETWGAFSFSLPSFSAGITGDCWDFRVERWHTSRKNWIENNPKFNFLLMGIYVHSCVPTLVPPFFGRIIGHLSLSQKRDLWNPGCLALKSSSISRPYIFCFGTFARMSVMPREENLQPNVVTYNSAPWFATRFGQP